VQVEHMGLEIFSLLYVTDTSLCVKLYF